MIATKRKPGGLHIFLLTVQALALLATGIAWLAFLLWTHGTHHEVALISWVAQCAPWTATVLYSIWGYDE